MNEFKKTYAQDALREAWGQQDNLLRIHEMEAMKGYGAGKNKCLVEFLQQHDQEFCNFFNQVLMCEDKFTVYYFWSHPSDGIMYERELDAGKIAQKWPLEIVLVFWDDCKIITRSFFPPKGETKFFSNDLCEPCPHRSGCTGMALYSGCPLNKS